MSDRGSHRIFLGLRHAGGQGRLFVGQIGRRHRRSWKRCDERRDKGLTSLDVQPLIGCYLPGRTAL